MRSSASTFAWKRCSSAARSSAVWCRQSAPNESRPCVYIFSLRHRAGRCNVTHFSVHSNCFCVMFIGVSGDALTRRTDALVARFRRQRPLRGGSLLVTILGDAIAPRGGTIALASLIKLAMPFGLTERLVRTSIGRLANEEWVSFERAGRASFYSPTTNGRARFAEATQRIYGAPPHEWDGLWTRAIVPPTLKSRRDDLREELLWLGFGQITPGVF